MAYQLFNLPKSTPVNASSVVLAGAKLYFYATGTSTLQNTYSDSTLVTPNANPVIADSNGLFGAIYLNPTLQYKMTLTTSADVLVYTVDPVNDQVISQAVVGGYLYPQTAAELAGAVTPTYYFYPPYDVRRYGALGNGSNNDAPAIQAAINAAAASAAGGSGTSRTVYLIDGGTHKTTTGLNIWASVSIKGGVTQGTKIAPVLSSGAALNVSKDSTENFIYNQSFSGFTIDGAGLTGTAKQLYIKNGNRTLFEQVNFANSTAVSDGTPAMLVEGSGYGIVWRNCHFTNNKRHWIIQRLAGAGDFPTQCLFDTCVIEGATQTASAAMAIINCSAIKLRDCTVQANGTLYALFIQTTSAGETGDDHEIDGGWWEDNGGGQAGSIGIYCFGASGRRQSGIKIHRVNFHQSTVNKPNYQIGAEWTSNLQVHNCTEGFGAGAEFVHDYGNNISYNIDWRGTSSSCQLKTPQPWASANFNGKAGISVNSSWNLTPTRTGAGAYLLTFVTAAPAVNYIVTASAEDASTVNSLVASAGQSSSTASFTVSVTLPTTNALTDGRTVNVSVMAIPA